MVSGETLLREAQQREFDSRGLDRFMLDKVHAKIVSEAESREEDIDELRIVDWQEIAIGRTHLVRRYNQDFREYCEKNVGCCPFDRRAEDLAELVTLKEAENGDDE
jgi:hypothetical protein